MENNPNKDLKRNIFKVPEGYFSRLEAQLIYRAGEKPSEAKTVTFWRPAMRIAAVLVIGVVAWMAWPTAKSQTPEEILAEIAVDDLSTYMEESISLLHEDILLPAEPGESEEIQLESESFNNDSI